MGGKRYSRILLFVFDGTLRSFLSLSLSEQPGFSERWSREVRCQKQMSEQVGAGLGLGLGFGFGSSFGKGSPCVLACNPATYNRTLVPNSMQGSMRFPQIILRKSLWRVGESQLPVAGCREHVGVGGVPSQPGWIVDQEIESQRQANPSKGRSFPRPTPFPTALLPMTSLPTSAVQYSLPRYDDAGDDLSPSPRTV